MLITRVPTVRILGLKPSIAQQQAPCLRGHLVGPTSILIQEVLLVAMHIPQVFDTHIIAVHSEWLEKNIYLYSTSLLRYIYR